jgi:hypothetical protein
MADASAPRTLQDLVSAFERTGPAVLDALGGRPVLTECDTSSREGTSDYETRAVVATWDIRVGLALARGDQTVSSELVARAGALFPVAKRAGGPFPDRIGLGRARTADISVPHASISKYHAYFSHDEGTGAWMVTDARSRNGTAVGEKRLGPGETMTLVDGASILLGERLFLFFTDAGLRKLVQGLARSRVGATR